MSTSRRGPWAPRGIVALTVALAGVVADSGGAGATHGDPAAPNDPLYGVQWGPQQVRAEQAWDTTTGISAVIAIVDSGIDLDHPDLAANVTPGNTFLGCGNAGCGNGDWESGAVKAKGKGRGQAAGHPHGTHVAGIAAAATNNGTGVAGVAPGARLLAIRVLDGEGSGSFEDVGRGIRWAADHGADVINLSLGAIPGAQVFTITGLLTDVTDAIAYANSQGVVVVAASGNESAPLCDTPGFDPGALCVTATDKRQARAWYSNEPVNSDLQSVSAPGGAGTLIVCNEDIVSTVPPGTGTTSCGYPSDEAYDEFAGTSMATPHVAGVAGLLASMGCTRGENLSVLTSTARHPITGARGVWTPDYGYGIVDAEAAVNAARTACA
jgi:subtilisin family serine protease